MNSIQNSLDPSSITTNVLLTLNSPTTQNKTLVLVEGIDDIRIYSSFFREDTTTLLDINGCLQVENIILNCNPKFESKYIILKDADFDHLNNRSYQHSNLFLTDTHDLETMMINNESIKHLCCEYLHPENSNLLENIFSEIEPLSYIRWYNEIKNIKLNFKVFNIASIYDGNQIIDINECINILYSKQVNSSKDTITQHDIQQFANLHNEVDPFLLSNGHDICECIWIKLKQHKHANITKKDVPRCLRMAYSKAYFEQTSMFAQISSWASPYGYNLFKSSQ